MKYVLKKNMVFKYVVARFQVRIARKHNTTIKLASSRKSGTTKKAGESLQFMSGICE